MRDSLEEHVFGTGFNGLGVLHTQTV